MISIAIAVFLLSSVIRLNKCETHFGFSLRICNSRSSYCYNCFRTVLLPAALQASEVRVCFPLPLLFFLLSLKIDETRWCELAPHHQKKNQSICDQVIEIWETSRDAGEKMRDKGLTDSSLQFALHDASSRLICERRLGFRSLQKHNCQFHE